jgi:TPR repeat protein
MSSPETLEKMPPDDLIEAAETGDAEAQSTLGRWYGENLPETPYAQMWFKRAADQGLPRALHNMGVVAFRSGDNELAIEWFRKAVAADWVNSIFPLGNLLEEKGDINRKSLRVGPHLVRKSSSERSSRSTRAACHDLPRGPGH